MGFVESHRAEIVVLIVLPISFLLWLFHKCKRRLLAPAPATHGERVARVGTVMRQRSNSNGGQLCRTDRSVFQSHSVRNSDKSGFAQIKLSDLRAILSLDVERGILHVEPGVTVGEVAYWMLYV